MLKHLAIFAMFLAVAQAPTPIMGQTANRPSSDSQKQDRGANNRKNPSETTTTVSPQKIGSGTSATESDKTPNGYQNTAVNITNSAPMPESWPFHERISWGANLALVLSSICGIGIGMWTLILLKRQTKATEDTANTALKQASHIVTSERAWMIANVEKLHAPKTTMDQNIWFSIRCLNKGKTPAFLLEIGNHGLIRHRSEKLPAIQLPYEEANIERWEGNGLPLQPGADIVRSNFSVIGRGTEKIHSGEEFLWIYGYIKYRDAFGENRETWYCFLWDNNCSISIEEDRPSCYMQRGPASYNRAN